MLSQVRVGIPSVVEAALLPGLIGWGRTRQLLMLGENISADEALRWGLVEKVVEPEALDDAVEEWVCQLEKNGPLAVRRQKALMRTWENVSLDEAIQAGVTAFGESFATREGEVSEPTRMLGAFFKDKSKI
jgi:enoyl-CoA hydratase